MEIVLDRKQLADALAKVSVIVPKNSPKPVLENVLLTTDEKGCKLWATDLETFVACQLNVTEKTIPPTLLPYRKLRDFVRVAKDEQIVLQIKQGKVVLKVSDFVVEVESANAKEYPFVFLLEEERAVIQVSALDFTRAIDRTLFCVAEDESRYRLNAIALELEGENAVRLIATDGCKISVSRMNAKVVDERTPEAKVLPTLVSPTAFRFLKKMYPKGTSKGRRSLGIDAGLDYFEVRVDSKLVEFKGSFGTIQSRLADGRFPRWRDVVGSSHQFSEVAEIGVAPAKEALARLKPFMDLDVSVGVEIELKDDRMRISYGEIEVVVVLEESSKSDPVKFCVNRDYLEQYLKSLGDERRTILYLTSKFVGKTPLRFESGSDLFLLYPMIGEEKT